MKQITIGNEKLQVINKISGVKREMKNIKQKLGHKFLDIVSPNFLFYVISHERSGTHLTINTILKNTYIRPGFHTIGEWYGPYDEPNNRFACIDAFNETWEQAAKKGLIIKSHCARDLFEVQYQKAKVIYVMRDPRDVLTSLFYYLNTEHFHRYNPQVSSHYCDNFSEFLRMPISPFLKHNFFLDGDFDNVAERWACHVSGWLKSSEALIITYEEIYKNYAVTLSKITDFLGLHLRTWKQPVGLYDAHSILPRKGIIGDWQNVFSKSDEIFLQQAVEKAGINWEHIIYKCG